MLQPLRGAGPADTERLTRASAPPELENRFDLPAGNNKKKKKNKNKKKNKKEKENKNKNKDKE